jgi:hypothetical protein
VNEWWSVLPAACLALGFAAGWLLRGAQRVQRLPLTSPAEFEEPEDKKKPAEIVNRGFFT